jgi:hypothetical protein
MDVNAATSFSQMDEDLCHVYFSPTSSEKDRPFGASSLEQHDVVLQFILDYIDNFFIVILIHFNYIDFIL